MRRKSPSAQMRRLSKTLAAKGSLTNFDVDFPPGKPPLGNVPLLAEPKPMRPIEPVQTPASEPKTSISDDTLSTFSCLGGLLPDEAADVNLIQAAGTDNDFVAIKRIAHVLAKRRHIDPDDVMPKLLELFAARSLENERSFSLPSGLGKFSLQAVCASLSSTSGLMQGACNKTFLLGQLYGSTEEEEQVCNVVESH